MKIKISCSSLKIGFESKWTSVFPKAGFGMVPKDYEYGIQINLRIIQSIIYFHSNVVRIR